MTKCKTEKVIPQVSLWNIYIPKHYNDGQPISQDKLDKWFRLASGFSQGMTVSDVQGFYIEDGNTYIDHNYAILLTTTKSGIDYLARYAKREFDQKSVMYFNVTDNVYFV